MTTRLYLVRHGVTKWNDERRFQGHSDVPLSELGRLQAEKVARRLRGIELDAVYSSDSTRAIDTARFIAEQHRLPVIQLKELREIDFGEWEGKEFERLLEEQSELVERWLYDSVNNPIPGGESYTELRDRVIPKVLEIIRTHQGSSVCIVAHSGPIKLTLCHVLGLEPSERRRFDLANASLSMITYTDDTKLRVSFLNDTCHLD